MKKKVLLFTLVAGFGSLVLSSYVGGPALQGGLNRTGANGSSTTCSGSGCHGSAIGPTVTITVDSGSTAVSHYTPGSTYTVKVHGAGSSNNYFGFEFASVSGSGTSQVQAGTTSGYPTNVGSDPLGGLNFVEQHAKLAATSAGVYDVSFQWTAPTTGIGNVTLYCTLNAVDGLGGPDAADVSGNTAFTLTQNASVSGITNVLNNISVTAFPNPVSNTLQLQMNDATEGNYTLQVYGMDGRMVANETIAVTSKNYTAAVNASNWTPGMYSVVLAKDGSRKTIAVVKQ